MIPCWGTFKELDFAAGFGKTYCLKAGYFDMLVFIIEDSHSEQPGGKVLCFY